MTHTEPRKADFDNYGAWREAVSLWERLLPGRALAHARRSEYQAASAMSTESLLDSVTRFALTSGGYMDDGARQQLRMLRTLAQMRLAGRTSYVAPRMDPQTRAAQRAARGRRRRTAR
jgi:hypothetical protein